MKFSTTLSPDLSASEGHYDCVEYLIKYAKVNPNIQDREGASALDDARKYGHSSVVLLLENYGKAYAPDTRETG